MPKTIKVTFAIGVWELEGHLPAGAIVKMEPPHFEAYGLNVPDEGFAVGFPRLPDSEGLWVMSCDAELPAYFDDEDIPDEEILSSIGFGQLSWLQATAVWRPANERDLYILRGEDPS